MSTAPSHFTGSWRTSTIALTVLALGLIAALVTVGFMKGTDALSALALTLAVIAFIAQLVIYAIQTMHSGAQLREAQQLNTQTREMISDVRARIDTTYQMVSSHNDALLRMSSVKMGVENDSPTAAPTSSVKAAIPDNPVLTGALAKYERLRVLPPLDECVPALELLETLSSDGVSAFSLDAAGDFTAQILNAERGLPFTAPDAELLDAGLIERVPDNPSKVRLTDAGYVPARLLTSEWPPGDEYVDIRSRLLTIREKASPSALTIFASIADNLRGAV